MTISISSSALSFGDVATSSSVGQSVTLSNSDPDNDVTVSLSVTGSVFSVSPASVVVPKSGSAAVTVTFTPTGQQAYSATLSGSGLTCALTGTGVDPNSLAGSGTDPNQFETESSAGASQDTGKKYYQIVVPNFALNGSNSTPGNTFVRMGSFPDLTDTTKFPQGFQKSLSLAKLVGDASSIGYVENADTKPESSLDTNSYNGDPNYMLGFADDTRYRQGDSSTSWQTRRDLSKQLLTRGGWWDHSDGNRVTTTAGDKLEIIQGNYKMVIMGRAAPPPYPDALSAATDKTLQATYWTAATQAKLNSLYTTKGAALTGSDITGANPAIFSGISASDAALVATQYGQQQAYASYVGGDVMISDISGGLLQENGPAPNHCIKSIEFDQSEEGGTWDIYQNNGLGNIYSSFYGDTADVFFGVHKSTWTGKAPSGYTPEDADVTNAYHAYTKSLEMHPDPTAIAGYEDPTIIDHVWAKKIAGYKGSSAKPVPTISDVTHAGTITGEVNASSVTSTTNVGVATVYSKITDSPSGDIINMTKAASITSLTAAGHIMDMSIALRTAINVGLGRDIFLGGKFAFSFGMGHEIRIGPKFELISSGADTFNMEEDGELALGSKLMIAPLLLFGI